MKKRMPAIAVSFVFLVLFLTGCGSVHRSQAVDSFADTSGSIQSTSEESSVDNGIRESSELSSFKMINSTTGWVFENN